MIESKNARKRTTKTRAGLPSGPFSGASPSLAEPNSIDSTAPGPPKPGALVPPPPQTAFRRTVTPRPNTASGTRTDLRSDLTGGSTSSSSTDSGGTTPPEVQNLARSIIHDFQRAIDRIVEDAGFGFESLSPAARARTLATVVRMMAAQLGRLPKTRAGFAEMESLAESMGLNAAWREIHGLKEAAHERNARLMLIDSIDMVAPAARAVAEGRYFRIIFTRPPEAPEEVEANGADLLGLARLVRASFGTFFPVEAEKVDHDKLIIAIRSWRPGSGRPRKGTTPTWQAIRDVLATAGLAAPTTTPGRLQEQWSDFKEHARGKWLPRTFEVRIMRRNVTGRRQSG